MKTQSKCRPYCECIEECEAEASSTKRAIAWIWGTLISACFLAGLFWFFMTSTAAAQEQPPMPAPRPACEPIDVVRAKMKQLKAIEFGGGFLANQPATVILFATMRGEHWIAFLFGFDGMACFMFEGVDFVSIPIPTGPRV